MIGKIGRVPSTTYEEVITFKGKDFDTAEGLKRIFEVTAAACAFPGLFAPVDLGALGPCIDGGAVNNSPIAYALRENDVNHIVMPVPFPSLMPVTAPKSGMGLLNHLIEILINERLYRDLKYSHEVNENVLDLDRLAAEGIIDINQLKIVKEILGIRGVLISEIRPEKSLCGNPFSGFFSKKERKQMAFEGRKATMEHLAKSEKH